LCNVTCYGYLKFANVRV